MNDLNILYAVDDKYYKYMLVSMYSLVLNNKDMNLKFHIISDNLNKKKYSFIENIFSSFSNINISFYDFNCIKDLIEKYNMPKWRDSGVANARIFFDKFVKDCDDLLYLDSDTIIVNSLKNIKNNNKTIHMVNDSINKEHINELDIKVNSYYNSGVIWININKWYENNCDKKIIDTLTTCKSFIYPDQDLLNMALKDDITPLHPKYNLFPPEYYFNSILLKKYYKQNQIVNKPITRVMEAKNKPVVLHGTPFYFCRPWDNKSTHPYKDIYNKYYSEIFNHTIKEPSTSKDILFKLMTNTSVMCPRSVKQKIKKIVRKN